MSAQPRKTAAATGNNENDEITTITLSGQVTEGQIQDWKAKHGDIFSYESEDKICYLKRPSRTTISAASINGSSDPFKFAEIVIANCWLAGDEALRSEDKYFMGLSQKINELVEIKVGNIKKL